MHTCNRVVVRAPAKVNLTLDITGLTEDGYHNLDSVMHAVSLSDLVVVGRRPGSEIRVTSSVQWAPEGEENIAHRAARAFYAYLDKPAPGLSIHLDKCIPAQAGLGGGSADAAGVLRALNMLSGANLSDRKLLQIAETVGADVPFCLVGGCHLARGKGELLTGLRPLPRCYFVIAKPDAGMGTAEAYGLYDSYEGHLERPETAAVTMALAAGDLHTVGRLMCNVFEEAAPLQASLMLRESIFACGALGASLTGSGSAVAGLFGDRNAAHRCLVALRETAQSAFLCTPLPNGAYILHAS